MKKLKLLVKDLKEVDDQFHDLYVKQDDGTYMLDVEDADYKTKIGEFRGNNIELRKKIERLESDIKKFEGVDPEKAREAQKKLDELEEGKLISEGKMEEVINQRVERLRQDLTGQTQAALARAEKAEKEATTFKGELTRISVDNGIQAALSEVGVPRKGAVQDILGRARSVWSVGDDGRLVAKDAQGNVMYGKEGKAPMTPQEWAGSLVQEAPFLFEASTGGGASGGKQNQNSNGAKVISRNDKDAFAANLEAIASGKVEVR